ncbi:MAG: hypothetical protein ACI4U2_04735 [Christensenellaceae bacterium]
MFEKLRGLFRSKYDKLTRDEVVSAICTLEREEETIEERLLTNKTKAAELMEKGKSETDIGIRTFYAKKIVALRQDSADAVRQGMYLLYNLRLLNRLKQAIDDNQFFQKTGKASLGNLLADQNGLAKFLNRTLRTRVKSEQVLTSADALWDEIESGYEENEDIYGVSDREDEVLSVMEVMSGRDGESSASAHSDPLV